MTGNLILDLVISVGGIVVVVAVSWALGAGRLSPMSEAEAIERAAFDEPDFGPAKWLLGEDGRAAVGIADDGESLIAFRVGDRIATRRFAPRAAPVSVEGGALVFRPADPGAPAVSVRAGDTGEASAWAAKLG